MFIEPGTPVTTCGVVTPRAEQIRAKVMKRVAVSIVPSRALSLNNEIQVPSLSGSTSHAASSFVRSPNWKSVAYARVTMCKRDERRFFIVVTVLSQTVSPAPAMLRYAGPDLQFDL